MRIAVAVSGGVDSLAALALLARAGHELLALHARFLDAWDTAVADGLALACAMLGVRLHVADLRAAFEAHVVAPFVAAHAAGRTPNPCAICNARIKFGALLERARALGCGALATGHYARQRAGLPCQARNERKDQSYFLGLVPRARLARAIFPLADIGDKAQARAIVREAGVAVPAPRESQDICFLGQRESFLESRGLLTSPGPVLLREEVGPPRRIGSHRGLWRHTIGQRRGLGIAWRSPLHVLGFSPGANALWVGPRSALGMKGLTTGSANFFLPPASWPQSLFCRTRHRGPLLSASVRVLENGGLAVCFGEAVFPSAPGQLAAIYSQAGQLLAAGEISSLE